ncbi:MAG: glycosyltransferase [Bacillota bacterium]|nr:glycosyltransferase [Bacillota bacterium]
MKVKILFIITTFQKDGPGNYLRYIIKYMDKEKFDIYACCLYNNGEIEKDLKALGVKTFTFDMKGFTDFSVVGKLKKLIHQIEPDIVNTILLRADLYGRFAAKNNCKVLISTILNQDDYRKKRTIKEKILMYFDEKLSNNYTDKILVEAQGVRDYCIKYQDIDVNKYEVIHSLIDVNEANGRVAHPFSNNNIIIGTAGRLHEQKGQKYLVEAFSTLSSKYPNAYLYIYGEGELKDELTELVLSLGIEQKVEFKGYSYDLYSDLSELDVYVMPSMWEGGAPISVLTAMTVGLPIVTTKVGGIEEFISDNAEGFLIDILEKENLVELIASRLDYCINNPQLAQEIGVSARRKVNNNFSAEIVSKEYQNLCMKLLAEKK